MHDTNGNDINNVKYTLGNSASVETEGDIVHLLMQNMYMIKPGLISVQQKLIIIRLSIQLRQISNHL